MKRVLVTGGTGFIGSNLCRSLLQDGYKVICVDNLYSGSMDNISDLLTHQHFQFIKHDIINPLKLGVDQIYNAACPASVAAYTKDPIFTIRTCTTGMINMLDLAEENDARILHFSTSEIYGDPMVSPIPESYRGNVNPIGPRSCYDEGKRCAESICVNYSSRGKNNVKIVRIFNAYGPGMDLYDGRVVNTFIRQALTGEDITVLGNGQQTRCFQYIDDLITGMKLMMASQLRGPVNLGSTKQITMLELAKTIIELTGSKSKIQFFPLRIDDPVRRLPDIRMAYEGLDGWEPRISLEEGLSRTISYAKKLLNL